MNSIRRILTVVAAIAAAATVCYVYYRFDPSAAGWVLRCPSKAITGLDCPGCGSQRALHALLHGDIAASVRYNAILLPALALLAVIWTAGCYKRKLPGFYRAVTGNVMVYSVLAVVVVWTIVRNLLPIN